MIEEVDRKFEHFIKPFGNRLLAYRGLKENLSKKLVDICDIITRFQADEQPKILNMPVFFQDAQFYCNLTKPFLVELDKEIAHHTAEVEA